MHELRGWMKGAMRLSVLGLLGAMTTGCPGSTSTTAGGGEGGNTGGVGGQPTGGGGTGGVTCQPETEICDGKDNDCDGQVDNVPNLPNGCACDDGTTQSCYSGPAGTEGIGACTKGNQTCENGAWGECVGQVTPQAETCNLADDDCNGQVDDGIGQITCGVGACLTTVEGCVDGVPGTCVPGQPQVEVCDGIDNNCNQIVDETDPDVGNPCLTNLPGACAAGTFKCTAGVLACEGSAPQAEACDGVDNDCNGTVDDVAGTGGMCSTGQSGVCDAGVISCQPIGGGMFMVDCYPIVAASPEVCDGLDNDCDGTVDDGDPGGGGACSTGNPGICGPGINHCVQGMVQCVANQMPTTEVCNGLDDNCNGQTDEGNPGSGMSCSTGVPGACATGSTTCTNGAIACTQTVMPQAETCNSIDDNCNGQVDEGNPGGGAACSTGLLGVCAAGTVTCGGGQLNCVQNVQSSPEVCGNAIDENCDGVAPAAPTVYFNETFANNNQGWTLGPEWAIGSAVASSCASSSTGNDPGTDHTPTADNGVAGVLIGGCYPTTIHTDYCITSPNINLSGAPGSVFLSYWRHLHTDYPSFVTSKVEVSSNGGSTWTQVYSVPSGQFQNDLQWTFASFDVTAQKSATTRVRFCYSTGPSTGIIQGGGWSVDDVQFTNVICN
ncbi:MAG: MopE-related protein [Polyangiaceae bacterium]